MKPGDPIIVIKQNLALEETWRYSGHVLETGEQHILLEAFFNREDTPFHGLVLGKGDRFVETFYTDRWYNIFEMHDRDSDQIKGWYCNICLPAVLESGKVFYVDLGLDLLVYPNGQKLILDEDEFLAMGLSTEQQAQARAALKELDALFA